MRQPIYIIGMLIFFVILPGVSRGDVTQNITAEGMVNSEVLLNDNGVLQFVRNNAEYKGCFVTYPEVVCGEAARAKKDGLLEEIRDLKKELTLIKTQVKPPIAILAPPVASIPIMPNPSRVSPPETSQRRILNLPTIGEVELTFTDPFVILKVLQKSGDKLGKVLGSSVVQRYIKGEYAYFSLEKERLPF